ncbi:MAG: hypothetical protein ACRDHZ_02860 [Ktedonobacteraceae bacterium]
MYQKNSDAETKEQCYQHIEKRLTAYYGPALPPHALPETAWLQVHAQLDLSQRLSSQQHCMRWPRATPLVNKQTVPANFQEVFAQLLLQTNYRHAQPNLCYALSPHLRQPRVRTSPLGRRQIRLTLPAQQYTLQPLEIEVLLAAGLARCSGASRTLFVLPRIFFACALLLSIVALPLVNVERRVTWLLLAALACCLAGGYLLTWQRRIVVLRADGQAVRWLGRERVCQGLHLLAEHGQARYRPAWGEPSLAERIAHVCGTSVPNTDKHLTLVG